MADRPALEGEGVKITREMLGAGVRAADLIGFQWGWDDSESVVLRAYLAMDAVRRGQPLDLVHIEEIERSVRRSL